MTFLNFQKVMVALSIHLSGLSHIADKYLWTMVMVALSIHLCGVVTYDTKYVLR